MSDERKNELLNIFIQVFCKYGLDGTTTKKLAGEAGLSEAGLYVYFKNKEDILLQCFEFHTKNVLRKTHEMLQKYGKQPERFVLAMFTYVKTLINENRFVYQVMLHPHYGQITKEVRNEIQANYKMQTDRLQEYFLNKEKATAVILLFNSALNNYILTQNEESFQLQMDFLLSFLTK